MFAAPRIPIVLITALCLFSVASAEISLPPFRSTVEPGQSDMTVPESRRVTVKKATSHLPAFPTPRPYRIWISANGKKSVKAALVKVDDHARDAVMLIDGKRRTAKWEIFSKADQRHLRKVATAYRSQLRTRITP